MKKLLAMMLCVVIALSLSVTAFAAISPSGKEHHEVLVQNGIDVDNEFKPGVTFEVVDGESVKVKPDPDKGTFDTWSVYLSDGTKATEGKDYVIVSGSLKDDNVTITPKTDIIICGNYNGKITDPATGNLKDPTSDPTGDSVVGLAVLMVAAGAVMIGAKRKLAK